MTVEYKLKDELRWEIVFTSGTDNGSGLLKFKVDGGYLYKSIDVDDGKAHLCMSFVPDIDLQRYQSHLRDAFRQGYEAGHKDAGSGIHESFEL